MSQREKIYETLRNYITFGKFKPGERLTQDRICTTLKAGRTPVREALSQLHIEGYLDFSPNKGVTITEISYQDIEKIYNVLSVLEAYAAEEATKNLTSKDLQKLNSLQNDQKQAWAGKDYIRWVHDNQSFHEYLAKASGNTFLYKIILNLRNRIYRYRIIGMTIPGAVSKYLEGHDRVLEAISGKDSKRAGTEMAKHLLQVSEELIQFLRQLPGL